MRRILRKVAENLPRRQAGELGSLGDTSTLLDTAVVSLRSSIALRSAEHSFGIALDDRRSWQGEFDTYLGYPARPPYHFGRAWHGRLSGSPT